MSKSWAGVWHFTVWFCPYFGMTQHYRDRHAKACGGQSSSTKKCGTESRGNYRNLVRNVTAAYVLSLWNVHTQRFSRVLQSVEIERKLWPTLRVTGLDRTVEGQFFIHETTHLLLYWATLLFLLLTVISQTMFLVKLQWKQRLFVQNQKYVVTSLILAWTTVISHGWLFRSGKK